MPNRDQPYSVVSKSSFSVSSPASVRSALSSCSEEGAPSASRTALGAWPGATAKVVDLYLRESFGGEPLREEERGALKAALEEAERGFNDKQRRAS